MLRLRLLQKWDGNRLVSNGQIRAHSYKSDKVWQPIVLRGLNRLGKYTTLEQDEHAGENYSAYADLNDPDRATRWIHRPRWDHPPIKQQRIQAWEKAALRSLNYCVNSILDYLRAKSQLKDCGEIELHVSGLHLRCRWHPGHPCECTGLADFFI